MTLHRLVLALGLFAGAAEAQSVTITPIVGGNSRVSGEFVQYVPVPAGAGFDSIPQRYRYASGMSVGALVDFDRAGALDFSALLTVNLADRKFSNPAGEQPCTTCSSTTFGVGFMATRNIGLGVRTSLSLGLGPEILIFAGDGASTEGTVLTGTAVEVSPLSIGALGSLGFIRRIGERQALRLQLGYRYNAPTYAPAAEVSVGIPPSTSSTAIQQFLFTVGYTIRMR